MLEMIAGVVWVGYIYIGLRALAEDDRFHFVRRLRYAIPMVMFSFILMALVFMPDFARQYNGKSVGAVFTMLMFLGSLLPCATIMTVAIGESSGTLISHAGALRIEWKPSYDKAIAAEKRHDFEMAETLYREYFEGAKKKKIAEEKLAEGRLAYGNLLSRMGREKEAAAQWALAARGEILPEQAIVAAVRAGDVYLSSGNEALAMEIWQTTLNHYPKDKASVALRMRLERRM